MSFLQKIQQLRAKIKPYESDLFLAAVIILVALTSFGLGRLSKIREQKVPITIENAVVEASGAQNEANIAQNTVGALQNNNSAATINALQQQQPASSLVASKSGKSYYYPWCSGVNRIKDANKIYFSSEAEAKKAGYAPAANCKGLK